MDKRERYILSLEDQIERQRMEIMRLRGDVKRLTVNNSIFANKTYTILKALGFTYEDMMKTYEETR